MVDHTYHEFACELCGNTEAVEVPHARKYTDGQPIHICVSCGFVYVKMRRSAERIAEIWSEEFFAESHYSARNPMMKSRHVYVAELIDTSIGLNKKQVSDIGAGEGQFLDILRRDEYGASVFGIEPFEANCNLLREMGIDCFQGTIEEYCNSESFQEANADIVTVLWTVEACQSCTTMLEATYRSLKPGGYVVVATGSRILVPFKKPLNDYLGDFPADTHPIRFSANTLQGILAVCGFETTHVNRYIDGDCLCVIAKKVEEGKEIPWNGDHYLDVYSFFDRWHTETQMYYPSK